VRDRGLLYNFLKEDNETPQDASAVQLPIDECTEVIEQPQNVDESLVVIELSAGVDEAAQQEIQSPTDLIDSFLKSDAKIKPNESEYKADLSAGMQEDKNFFTETLADIYALQGHKDKAIEIYEQLILKNPEKYIYFAAQIKRLNIV